MGKKVSLTIDIKAQTAEIKKTTEAVNALNEEVKNVGKSVEQAHNAFAQWSQMAMALSSLSDLSNKLNGHIQECASSFDDFDQAMRAANTMMGLGEDGFQEMKGALSEMSKEIPKTRKELAEGLYQVISNGVTDPVEALKLLETSARSSVGGIADLGQVVGVTATIWKNYGLDASAAGDIQDKIQLTAKNGVTSFEQLAAALPAVSGNAATLGVTIDELLASFATLTGVSGNTAAVSTQLGAVFTALVKPSSEAAKMAEEMGLQFDAAAIKSAGGFEQFLAQLKVAVSEYSKSSGVLEQEVYGRLFGSAEALKALIPLQGELASKYSENVSAMNDSTGTMDEAFGQMAQTGGAVRQMLQNSVQAMTDWIGSVASAIAPTMDYITIAGDMCMSIGSIVKGFTMAIPAVKAFSAALTANPIGVVVAAVAALGAALYALYQNCDTFREAVDEMFGELSQLAGELFDELKPALDVVWDALKVVGKFIGGILVSYLKFLIKVFRTVASVLGGVLLKAIQKVKQWFSFLSDAVISAWNAVKSFLGIEGDGASATDNLTGAIEEQTEAVENEANAYDQLYEAAKRANYGSPKNAKADKKTPAPQGSLKALQEQIQAVQAKVELEVDPTKRSILYNELDKLKKEKIKIEAALELQVNNEKLKTIVPSAKGLPDMSKGLELKGVDKMKADLKGMQDAQMEVARSQMTIQDNVLSTADSFGVMGQAIGGAAGSMMQWAAQSVAAIMQVIPQIVTLMTAKQAEGMAGATASGASLPFPANIAAIAAGVATVIASFAKMPKFAAGGIISGPTIGLMGEYSGASNNPEVVAPLNKLKSMLGDVGGGMDGRVQFEIKGRKLVGVLARENSIRSRS